MTLNNPVLENIKERRSIRAFSDKPVSRDELATILTAGNYAASGNNVQSWLFTAITNPDLLVKANNVFRESLANSPANPAAGPHFAALVERAKTDPNMTFMYGAGTFVIVSNQTSNPNAMADSSLALGNMMLEARALGIGSCWINLPARMNQSPIMRAFLDTLEIPADHYVYGALSLGYPKGEWPVAPERKPNTVRIFD